MSTTHAQVDSSARLCVATPGLVRGRRAGAQGRCLSSCDRVGAAEQHAAEADAPDAKGGQGGTVNVPRSRMLTVAGAPDTNCWMRGCRSRVIGYTESAPAST